MSSVSAVKLQGVSPQGDEFVLVIDGDKKTVSVVIANPKQGVVRVREVQDYTKPGA